MKNRHLTTYSKRILIFAVLGILCLLILQIPSAFGQDSIARKSIENQKRVPTFANNVSGLNQQILMDSKRIFDPRTMCPPPPPDTLHLTFNLDWTNYQIHRIDDYSPIVIILSGTIISDAGNIWNLIAAPTLPGQDPILYFMEDTFGRTGAGYGSNISLNWEIAVDGGPFNPMNIGPGSVLSTAFPPGSHTFQVRITGIPQYHQGDGYYHLQLEQNLVPQL